MSLSDYSENLILNWLLNMSSTPVRPSAVYMALHTSNPGETGSTGEVTVGTDAGYVRKAIPFADAVSGNCASESSVAWTVAAGSAGYTVTHVSLWDALTAGNALFIGTLLVPRALVASGVLTFAIGDVVATLD